MYKAKTTYSKSLMVFKDTDVRKTQSSLVKNARSSISGPAETTINIYMSAETTMKHLHVCWNNKETFAPLPKQQWNIHMSAETTMEDSHVCQNKETSTCLPKQQWNTSAKTTRKQSRLLKQQGNVSAETTRKHSHVCQNKEETPTSAKTVMKHPHV